MRTVKMNKVYNYLPYKNKEYEHSTNEKGKTLCGKSYYKFSFFWNNKSGLYGDKEVVRCRKCREKERKNEA